MVASATLQSKSNFMNISIELFSHRVDTNVFHNRRHLYRCYTVLSALLLPITTDTCGIQMANSSNLKNNSPLMGPN